MTKPFAFFAILAALAGCAASTDEAGGSMPRVMPSAQPEGVGTSPDAASMAAAAAPAAIAEPGDSPDVEVALRATDTTGRDLSLRACVLMSRGGDGGGVMEDHLISFVDPSCSDAGDDAVTRVAVDELSQTVVTLYAEGHPGYATALSTGRTTMDLSGAPLSLLTSAQIDAAYAAAGVSHDPQQTSVVVAGTVEGGAYDLLLDTMGLPGADAIYLDAHGRVVDGAERALDGGFVVFPNVRLGMHMVAFSHDSRELEMLPGMGWTTRMGASETYFWALPGQVSLVAGIEAVGTEG